ncbi:MAG: site-specific integrase [Desulfobacteraceae bacterium]|nr:site-specific integrase [Desulfobacteraceae bacterium]
MTQSYLIQNKSGYCFRIAVPTDLRNIIGLTEIRRSLRVGTLTIAREKAWIISGKIRRLFRWLKERLSNGFRMKLNKDKVNQIINKYIQDGLDEIEDEMLLEGKVGNDGWDDVAEDLYFEKDLYVDSLINKNLHETYDEVDEILAAQNIDIDRNSIDYKRLCFNVLKSRVGFMDVKIARRHHNFSETFDFKKYGIPEERKGGKKDIPSAETKSPSILLSEMIEKHQKENIRAGAWSTSTKNDYKSIGKVLVTLLKDPQVHTLGFDEFRHYKEAMQCLPPRFLSTSKYHGMSASDIIKLDLPSDQTISTQSINKNFAYTKSLFSWALANHYIDENPTSGLTIKERKTSKESREAFDLDNLNTIFGNLKSKVNHPYQFWIPVLGLFTGCRREEICQLHKKDLKQSEDGIWYLDINEDTDDKNLKNPSSKRLVPLHPCIVEDLKFIDFVKTIDHERIFPKLKKTNDRYGHYFGKWFNEFIGKIGVKTATKNFHSFRHGFITNLTEKGVSDVLVKDLVGHSQEGVTHRVYFKGYSVEQLYNDGICKLDFGADLSRLV